MPRTLLVALLAALLAVVALVAALDPTADVLPDAEDAHLDDGHATAVIEVDPIEARGAGSDPSRTSGPSGQPTDGGAEAPRSPAGQVTGTVETVDGIPAAYVQVTAGAAQTESDAQGGFSLTSEDIVRVEARAGKDRSDGVLAAPGGAPVRLVLRPTAALQVRVRRIDGAKLGRAQVQVHTRRGTMSRTVDADGRVRFEGLATGDAILEVDARTGYARVRPVRLTAGDNPVVGIAIHAGREIGGQVVYASTQKPLEGARVEVQGMGRAPQVVRTDAEGRYVAYVAATAETVELAVVHPGFQGQQTSGTSGADFALVRAASVQGTVEQAPGQGVAGARVALLSFAGVVLAETRSDVAGAYALPRPPADDAGFRVLAVKGASWASAPVEADLAAIPAIRLRVSAPVLGALEGVAAGTTVRLRALGARTGDPADFFGGALEAARRRIGVSGAAARTDAQGRFRFPQVPAGVYRIEVGTPTGTWLPGASFAVTGHAVDLGAFAQDGHALEAEVTDLAGRPLAGASVFLQLDDDNQADAHHVRTDAEGRAAVVGLPAGTYRVTVRQIGHGLWRSRITLPSKTVLRAELGAHATLRGHVEDPDGAVTGPATLHLEDLLTEQPVVRLRRVQIAKGAFTLARLPAGEYRLWLVTADGRRADLGWIGLLPDHTEDAHFALPLTARAD